MLPSFRGRRDSTQKHYPCHRGTYNFIGSIILKVMVRQIQHKMWCWRALLCHSTLSTSSARGSSRAVLTHLSSIYWSSNRWDHLPCFKLFSAILREQLVVALISCLISWPSAPAKIWRVASDMHLNGLLHISIFRLEGTEEGICDVSGKFS